MGTGTAPPFQVFGIDHVGLTVPDLEAAVRFYEDVFNGRVLYRMGPLDSREMPPAATGDWTKGHINVADARLSFVGMQLFPGLNVEIYQFERPANAGRAAPGNADLGYHHIALRVGDVAAATAYLRSKGFRIYEGPIDPPDGPLHGSKAQYLADPWGNQFELMEYEAMNFMKPGGAG
jgi:glyoxylase I family protein